jgi:hypothetical protein
LLRLRSHEHSIDAAEIHAEQMPRVFLNSDYFDLPQISALKVQAARRQGPRSLVTQVLLRLHEPLETESTLIVSDANGNPLITDGPFAETKEQLIC